MMYNYELHVHTSECDKASIVSGEEMVRMYKQAGYDGIVITNHMFALFYEWYADELSRLDRKGIMKRWLRGYENAKCEGDKCDFTVLCGAEVRFDGGNINDYLVYGLTPEDFLTLPLLNRLNGLEELVSVLPENALTVQAHPFRNNMTVTSPELLFGIEVYNGCTEDIRNNMAKMFAEHYGKTFTSGTDLHNPIHMDRCGGIATDTKIKTPADLVRVLKTGEYTLIKQKS